MQGAAVGATPTRHRLMEQLPAHRYSFVPELSEARRLASAVREGFSVGGESVAEVELWLSKLGWGVRHARLGASKGGLQAILGPCSTGFLFTVDDEPTPAERQCWEACDSDGEAVAAGLRRWRLAHEIGHVFFYDQERPPRRLLPQSRAEENFCDVFAAHLLLPSLARSAGVLDRRSMAGRWKVPSFLVDRLLAS
jgi:hypothetical protein